MLIDNFIEKSKSMEISSKGSNKTCYLFEEYALLCGQSAESYNQVTNRIELIKQLKLDGVNVVCPLQIKIVDGKSYELQERANGEALFPVSLKNDEIGQLKYLKTLVLISEEDISFYEKMLSDWDSILALGIDIDPSKSSNFFYKPGSISFVDLNICEKSYEERKKYQYLEMASVLRGGGLLWQCKNVYHEATELVKKIYIKLGEAVLNRGEDIQEYINQVDQDSEYNLEEYFSKYVK